MKAKTASYPKSRRTIAAIVRAARKLFVERNYADVTIADLAAQAEVSPGALYHHFSSKEDVYLQMMHQVLQEIGRATEAEARNKSGPYRERLKRSVLSFLELPREYLRVVRLVRRDINIFSDPTRKELIRAYQAAIPEQVESILLDGMAEGAIQQVDARVLSWQMVALVEISLHSNSRKVLGTNGQIAEYITSLFVDGIGAREAVGVGVSSLDSMQRERLNR